MVSSGWGGSGFTIQYEETPNRSYAVFFRFRELTERSRGAGSGHQADDRQFPVALALVPAEPGRGRGDLLPGILALRSVELLGRHRHLPAFDLDLDLVGMGGDVVVPRRVPRRPACRGDDQPAAVQAGKPADRIGTLESALAADGGQDQRVHAHKLAHALTAEPVGHHLVHPSGNKSGRLAGASRSGGCIEAHRTSIMPVRWPARRGPGASRGSTPHRRGPSPTPRTTRPGPRA